MADIFQEVDDLMRQERVEKFWKENGNFVIGALVAIILFTAVFSGYRHWNEGVLRKQTAQIIAAIESPDFPKGAEESAKNLRPNLRAVLLMNAAGTYHDKGELDKALALYQAIHADRGTPPDYRDLAALLSVRVQMQSHEKDEKETPDAAQFLGLLRPVWENGKSPWRHHAHLEAAVIETTLNRDYTAARSHLADIKDNKAGIPASLQEKAQALDHVYAIEQKKTSKSANGEKS